MHGRTRYLNQFFLSVATQIFKWVPWRSEKIARSLCKRSFVFEKNKGEGRLSPQRIEIGKEAFFLKNHQLLHRHRHSIGGTMTNGKKVAGESTNGGKADEPWSYAKLAKSYITSKILQWLQRCDMSQAEAFFTQVSLTGNCDSRESDVECRHAPRRTRIFLSAASPPESHSTWAQGPEWLDMMSFCALVTKKLNRLVSCRYVVFLTFCCLWPTIRGRRRGRAGGFLSSSADAPQPREGWPLPGLGWN